MTGRGRRAPVFILILTLILIIILLFPVFVPQRLWTEPPFRDTLRGFDCARGAGRSERNRHEIRIERQSGSYGKGDDAWLSHAAGEKSAARSAKLAGTGASASECGDRRAASRHYPATNSPVRRLVSIAFPKREPSGGPGLFTRPSSRRTSLRVPGFFRRRSRKSEVGRATMT